MKGIMEQYREYLPISAKTPCLTLGEGNTPLVRADNLSEEYGMDIHLKLEGLNPTGSFKDRGMVLAVAKALEKGSDHVICASTGNTSSSAAAYAAKAGIRCTVLIPAGKIAYGKLAQAFIYGAKVIPVEGNFDQALKLTMEMAGRHPVTVVNSINPYRIEGQKTGAFEILESLGKCPDAVFLPVGNAGNITAYWKGFREFSPGTLPFMAGIQAAGAAPLVLGRNVENPDTLATAIRIGDPVSRDGAMAAVRESSGFFDSVTDEEILEAYALLASREGVFCEPASAASLAGLLKKIRAGAIKKRSLVVCILTGNGLKDPDTALGLIRKPEPVPCEPNVISEILRGGILP
ncbi:MAG: threonine synthase [Clostridia bacterium]